MNDKRKNRFNRIESNLVSKAISNSYHIKSIMESVFMKEAFLKLISNIDDFYNVEDTPQHQRLSCFAVRQQIIDYLIIVIEGFTAPQLVNRVIPSMYRFDYSEQISLLLKQVIRLLERYAQQNNESNHFVITQQLINQLKCFGNEHKFTSYPHSE